MAQSALACIPAADTDCAPLQVGSEVARRGKGLGFATVVAYDPYASEAKALALGVELVSFDKALAMGDFFSLHMPLTPDTKVCPAALLRSGTARTRVVMQVMVPTLADA